MEKRELFPYCWDEHRVGNSLEIQAWAKNDLGETCFLRVMDFPVSCEMQLPSQTGYQKIKWDNTTLSKLFAAYKTLVRSNIDWYNGRFVTEDGGKVEKKMPELVGWNYHESREFYYFQKEEKPFVTLYFKSREDMYNFIGPLKNKAGEYNKSVKLEEMKAVFNNPWFLLKIWETDIHSIKKFLVQLKARHTGWFSITNYHTPSEEQRLSKHKYPEYLISFRNVKFLPDRKDIPPVRVMSYDIETYSDKEGEFPEKSFVEHVVYMISCVSEEVGKPEGRRRTMLTFGDCPVERDDVQLITAYDEEELILKFIDYIEEDDPDLITGYNTLKFDWPYLQMRAKKRIHPWNNPWAKCSRLIQRHSEESSCDCDIKRIRHECPKCSIAPFKVKEMTSSGRGENKFEGVEIKGRMSLVDMCVIAQTDYKSSLKMFNLNFVSLHFLGEGKRDVSANEMFKIFEEWKTAWKNHKEKNTKKNQERLEKAEKEYGRVGDYCIQDSELVNRLMVKLKTWSWLCSQASVYGVNPENVYLYGQSKRGISMFYEACVDNNIIMTERKGVKLQYKGGYVSEPKRGVHTTFCVDYNSLYPNTGRRYNIDFTTLLDRKLTMQIAMGFLNQRVKGFSMPNCEVCECVRGTGEHFYCPFHEEYLIKTLLDTVETHGEVLHDHINIALWKEELDIDKTPETEDEYDEKGRKKKKKKTVVKETRYNLFMFMKPMERVIRGENRLCRGIFPILAEQLISKRKAVKREQKNYPKDSIEFITLEQEQLTLKMATNSLYGFLGRKAGKYLFPEGAMTITFWGRDNIIKTGKHLEEFYKEEEAEVIYGDSVTADTPCLLRDNAGNVVVKRIDELAGKEDEKKRWHSDKMFWECDYEAWTEAGWTPIKKVIKHKIPKEKKVFEILTHSGCVRVTEDHSLLNSRKEKVTPNEVLSSLQGGLQGGIELLHSEDLPLLDFNENRPLLNFNEGNDYDVNSLRLFLLLNAHHPVRITKEDGEYYFEPCEKEEYGIVSITEIKHEEIDVYDLETESHHFHAGVGSLIVHNTDSVMIEFHKMKGATGDPVEDRKIFYSRRQEFEDVANMINQDPMHVEYEKGMYGAFFQKKMYAYYKIKDDGNFEMEQYSEKDKSTGRITLKPVIREKGFFKGQNLPELNVKGIPLARREDDFFKLDNYEASLRTMLSGKGKEEIKQVMMEVSLKLMTRQVSLEDLTIVSGIKSHYADESNKLKVFSDHRASIGKPVVGGDRYTLVVCMPRNATEPSDKLKVGVKLRGLDEYEEGIGTDKHEEIDRLYYIKKCQRSDEIYTLLHEKEIERRLEEQKEKDLRDLRVNIAISFVLILGERHKEILPYIKWVERDPFRVFMIACSLPKCRTKMRNIEMMVKRRQKIRTGFRLLETKEPMMQIYKGFVLKNELMKEIRLYHTNQYPVYGEAPYDDEIYEAKTGEKVKFCYPKHLYITYYKSDKCEQKTKFNYDEQRNKIVMKYEGIDIELPY